MDLGEVALQVVSHNTGLGPPSVEHCQAKNHQLAQAVQNHKTRYAGLTILPTKESACPASEHERCAQDLKFVGTLIPNHAEERYYDDEIFWPVLEHAQELDIPIYLHPTSATAQA